MVSLSAKPNFSFFVVSPLDVKNPDGFLQVASWNGSVFQFFAVRISGHNHALSNDSFQVETIEQTDNRDWTWQGSSFDAFTDGQSYDASYLDHLIAMSMEQP